MRSILRDPRELIHVAICSVLIVSAGVGCKRATTPQATAAAPKPASVVRVVAGRPQRKTLVATTTRPARIEAFETTPIFSKLAGYVEQLHVDIGQRVEKDEALVTLREPELADDVTQKAALVAESEAKLRQAEANDAASAAAVETARAKIAEVKANTIKSGGEYERAKSEYERLKELAASGSVTRKVTDEALNQLRATEAALEAAKAAVVSAESGARQAQAYTKMAEADRAAAEAHVVVAKADLAHARTMLDYATIRAPFNGVVTKRLIDTGHFVQPAPNSAAPLLVVARIDKVRVFVEVSEMEAAGVDVGAPVVIHTQAVPSRNIEATVTTTSWSLETANRSLTAVVDVANENARLRPGMYATATIELARRNNALVIPTTAVVHDGTRTDCCCVVNGTIERRPVELGIRSGTDVEVLKGLDDNVVVVLAQAAALVGGQKVEVTTAVP